MKCAWQAYLNLLPIWLRKDVDKLGREHLQELRMRIGRPPELVTRKGTIRIDGTVNSDDLNFCINAASRYSPWASTTVRYGYITAIGGHRVGICGEVAIVNNQVTTITNITSLCIRVARDFPELAIDLKDLPGSVLLIGPPGSGKTTLLRDLIRQKSNYGYGPIAVVDERKEIFPVSEDSFCFSPGMSTEVISGCNKAKGLEILVRTMTPRWIAVDEVTAAEDSEALVHSGWCGVSLIATAHANDLNDLKSRPVYHPLVESGLFDSVIVLGLDKSWKLERMNICK